MSPKRHIVTHLHLLHNAGASVDRCLRHNFNEQWKSLDRELKGPRFTAEQATAVLRDNPRVVALSSVRLRPPLISAEEITFIPIVFLRSPLDRIASAYGAAKRQAGMSPSAVAARENDLGGWIEFHRDRSSVQCSNFQTLMLSTHRRPDGRLIEANDTESHLKSAKGFLRSLPAFGLVESYLRSWEALHPIINEHHPSFEIAISKQDMMDRSAELARRLRRIEKHLGEERFEELKAANKADQKLHDWATAYFAKKIGVSPQQSATADPPSLLPATTAFAEPPSTSSPPKSQKAAGSPAAPTGPATPGPPSPADTDGPKSPRKTVPERLPAAAATAPLDPSEHDADIAVYAKDVAVIYEVRVKRFGPPLEVPALQGFSLTLREGSSLGVLGTNGAGKSTLIKAIAGTVALSEGELLVRSQPKRVSVGSTMRPELTGRQNITLGLYALGLDPAEADDLVGEVIDYSELGDFIELPLDTYSSGMKARLKFAISTQVQPDILLLDEALAVGDAAFKEKSLERVNEIKSGAGAVILVTHNPKEISKTCDMSLWLEKGITRMLGPTAEVIEAYENRPTEAGS